MGQRSQLQTGVADYLELLELFHEQKAHALIVGGQAVNFWAEAFEEEEPELRKYRPFTSADLDLHRPDVSALRVLRRKAGTTHAERDPFGKAFTIVSHTFLIEDKAGKMLVVEDLKMVPGLTSEEVMKSAIEVEIKNVRFRVLNPIACLKAKLYNVGAIDQRARQDERHVRILILCVRAFIRRLVVAAQSSGNCRPALKALQQVMRSTSDRKSIKLAGAHRFALFQVVPVADLKRSGVPKLSNFVTRRLPAWEQLFLSSGSL